MTAALPAVAAPDTFTHHDYLQNAASGSLPDDCSTSEVPSMNNHRFVTAKLAAVLVAACSLAAAAAFAAQTIPQPSLERLKGLPVAPEKDRVDIAMPVFSNPTRITNPLFPMSNLHSTVLLGNVDHRAFRSETTLIPRERVIEWMGQKIRVVESQYLATLDGRIEEVALDWYAQADDGSVWYFGEDVFNYHDGAIEDHGGTWVAGEDGPAAMIMPGKPRVGDVFRPENMPGSAFEEVRIQSVGQKVDGPRGPVNGAIVTQELHQEGHTSNKTFAPGYGEFWTANAHELEALALAVPTDALPGPMPAELEAMTDGTVTIFDAARAGDWKLAESSLATLKSAWTAYRSKHPVPPLLETQMGRALAMLAGDPLAPALDAHHAGGTARGTTALTIAALDLQLRYRPPVEVDRDRFDAWARQLQMDASGDDPGAVASDVTLLEWVRDRFVHALDQADAGRMGAELKDLRSAADAEDLKRAAALAEKFRRTAAGLRLMSAR